MRRHSIAVLFAGLLLVATGYAAALLFDSTGARTFGAWALALGASLVLSAMLALAAVRGGAVPWVLGMTTVLVFVATFGGLAFALAMPAPTMSGPLLLGLPRVTAVMLLVAGLVPLVALPLAYARAFQQHVLSEADIARIKAVTDA